MIEGRAVPCSFTNDILLKGPAIKKFMPLVVIIEAHEILKTFGFIKDV